MNSEWTKGIIDLHIHSAPDIRQRKMNDIELMEAGVRLGARALVIKSHMVPTMDRATLVNQIRKEKYPDSDLEMFGAIALNRSVGGINPYAAEAALKLGAKIVWLPTNTSSNHFSKSGKNAEAARDAGVEKIVITHPEFHIVGMTLEERIQIVKDYNVLLEMEYAQPIGGGVYKKNLPENAETMRQIGCEHFIVSTDSGQMQNPYWYESIVEYIDYLYDQGFTKEEIDTMTKYNPAKMLDIEV